MSVIKVTPLFSGSKGNSVLVQCDSTNILIDAGVSKTRIVKKLAEYGVELNAISGVIITHAHSDHIGGLRVLCKSCSATIYMSENCFNEMQSTIDIIGLNKVGIIGDNFTIGNVNIRSFALPHDSACTGYCFENGEDKFTFMTDLGEFDMKLLDIIKGSKEVYIESNHDEDMVMASERYPMILKKRILSKHGHLSNESCGKVCSELYKLGTKSFILGHLSEENNFPSLAYRVVNRNIMTVAKDSDFSIKIAGKDGLL